MKINMKFILLLFTVFLLNSCTNIKKEYKDGQDVWDSVNGAKYHDLVEVWGVPAEKITYEDRIDCIWADSQVKIKEGSLGDITLSFDKYITPFGSIEGIGKPHDLDCWRYHSKVGHVCQSK